MRKKSEGEEGIIRALVDRQYHAGCSLTYVPPSHFCIEGFREDENVCFFKKALLLNLTF